ncbi:glycosyltransferase [Deefgea sp. CFH1-16]|uniref:glycosyltransferase n=1 Tax=Deefgea sp. CFH1-16 TaxID=2675457 RepID=UPI001940294A
MASLQPDILHITSLFDGFGDNSIHSIGKSTLKIPTAVTFYDAIPLIEEEKYLSPNPDYEKFYRTQLKFLSNADLFLAISESSRQEAITHLNLDACKITNIAAAVGLDFKPKEISTSEVQKIRTHFGLSRPFIMYSGATDERKNHLRLIKAFSLLSPEIKEKYQIAIVGGLPDENKNKFEQYASYYGIKPTDLIITGSVTDEQMINLYNICDLFVFPSWHEGFGLPALEAMSCGAAVIGSNTTSIPEVIGREDALFDPFDANSICEKITDVLTNETLRKELSEHGIEYSKNFSWDESARRSISAFEKFYVSNQKKSNIIDTSTLNAGLLSTLIKNISTISKATYHQKDLLKISEAISNNHKTSDNKQLLIDISQLVNVDSKTGIQRVVRSILYELLTSPPKGFTIEAVYATSEKNGYKYARRFISNFLNLPTIDIDDESINVFNGDIFLGLDLQPHVVLKQASTYENWKNIGVKIYFTIYDLLPISLPNKFPDGAYSAHSKWLTILGKADGALCISRAVADEMADWLETCSPKRLRPFKLGWFHLGADVSSSVPSLGFTIDNENTLKKLSNCPTFLMVGTIEPRKGQMQTLLAFEALWGQSIDVNLVIVGKRGWNVDFTD